MIARLGYCVRVAVCFRNFIAAFHGGCFRRLPRWRFAEFIDHAIDACLALVAIVTNDTHGRTVPRLHRPPCPDLNSGPNISQRTLLAAALDAGRVMGIPRGFEETKESENNMQPMHMTERYVGPVTILDLAGTITIDADAIRLKDKINSLLLQQRTSVILNLAQVSYIDSGGLGQLVASYAAVMKAGGGLKLLNVNKKNHDLLSITRLVTVFQTFDTEDTALRSFEIRPAVAAGMVAH